MTQNIITEQNMKRYTFEMIHNVWGIVSVSYFVKQIHF